MKILFGICGLIANQLALVTLAGAVVAFMYPPLFLIFKDSFLWFFAATMFAMGIVLDSGELQETLHKPGRIGLGVLTQFTPRCRRKSRWVLLSWPVRRVPWPAM